MYFGEIYLFQNFPVQPLPYSCLPRIMLVHLLHFITMWLNNFPVSNGISANFSPGEIILRHHLSYKYHCHAPFGAYCETHEDNEPTNSMQSLPYAWVLLVIFRAATNFSIF
jgi:hypothetical protein